MDPNFKKKNTPTQQVLMAKETRIKINNWIFLSGRLKCCGQLQSSHDPQWSTNVGLFILSRNCVVCCRLAMEQFTASKKKSL